MATGQIRYESQRKRQLGWYALHVAAGYGFKSIIRLHLAYEAVDINELNVDGEQHSALAARSLREDLDSGSPTHLRR